MGDCQNRIYRDALCCRTAVASASIPATVPGQSTFNRGLASPCNVTIGFSSARGNSRASAEAQTVRARGDVASHSKVVDGRFGHGNNAAWYWIQNPCTCLRRSGQRSRFCRESVFTALSLNRNHISSSPSFCGAVSSALFSGSLCRVARFPFRLEYNFRT